MTDSLLTEWGEHDVLTLTLNRPERRNALDPELLIALAESLDSHGDRARAVILRGAGVEAFSAGYDLSRLAGTPAELDAETAMRWGLITEVSDDIDGRVTALAQRLATSPRDAVHGTKASLNLLERRGVAGEDLLQAQQLRATAAASPERKDAVRRRQKKVTGK